MLLSSYNCSFIVQATVIRIINYDSNVNPIVNYDHKTFIVPATGPKAVNIFLSLIYEFLNKLECLSQTGFSSLVYQTLKLSMT